MGYLRAGLLLLLLPESEQTDTGNLDDLETDTGNITLGLALTTETGEEDLVVLIDEVQATVVGDYTENMLANRYPLKRYSMIPVCHSILYSLLLLLLHSPHNIPSHNPQTIIIHHNREIEKGKDRITHRKR